MLTGALLGLMEQLALNIITLTEASSEREFFDSRITRSQTLMMLGNLAKACANLPPETCERMHQIDWAAWHAVKIALTKPEQHPLQIWVAIKELTPMTLQQLYDYKRTQPQLFSMVM
ncbi:MAG: hypothetical protein PHH36_09000 [Sideroxydans sp.]|nr:hypothetical protein [Sideroxydans sp.]